MTYEEWKTNKKIEYDENGWDENGFNEDWRHIVTGTRYDENGFNKDGTIHQKTKLPRDGHGHRREYYTENKVGFFSLSCYSKRIQKLFFRNDELNIIRKLVTDFEILNINKIRNYEAIELVECTPSQESIYTGPRCLDGSPDMRYSGGFTYKHTTTIKIRQGKDEKVKVLSGNIYETKVQEIINIYNNILYLVKDNYFKELYDSLISINNKCKQNSVVHTRIVLDLKEKKSIYKKLELKQNKFTNEQKNKFKNLGRDIEETSNKLKNYENYESEFTDIIEKILQRTKELELALKEDNSQNEIDDLFTQIGD